MTSVAGAIYLFLSGVSSSKGYRCVVRDGLSLDEHCGKPLVSGLESISISNRGRLQISYENSMKTIFSWKKSCLSFSVTIESHGFEPCPTLLFDRPWIYICDSELIVSYQCMSAYLIYLLTTHDLSIELRLRL